MWLTRQQPIETWKISDMFFGVTTYLYFKGDKLQNVKI